MTLTADLVATINRPRVSSHIGTGVHIDWTILHDRKPTGDRTIVRLYVDEAEGWWAGQWTSTRIKGDGRIAAEFEVIEPEHRIDSPTLTQNQVRDLNRRVAKYRAEMAETVAISRSVGVHEGLDHFLVVANGTGVVTA
jgi:hypothetical protein